MITGKDTGLCYWHGKGGFQCSALCPFLQEERFCLLAATVEEMPKRYVERFAAENTAEAAKDWAGMGAHLLAAGYSTDGAFLIFAGMFRHQGKA